ncbi:MAG: carbohydrate ABC transporter permease [Alphaproteobacteria bacterium]|nr:carbohydrate ABC transporter permease [Alphaproteobacteria bacterium]
MDVAHGLRRRFTWINGIALTLAIIWTLFPIYWTLNASLKHWSDLYTLRDTKELVPTPSAVEGPRSVAEKQPSSLWFPTNLTFENYRHIFVDHENPMGNNETASWRALVTSTGVAGVATFFSMVIGLMAAFAFARHRTGGNFLPFYVLSFRMIPAMVIAIPFAYFAATLGPNVTPFMLTLIYIAYTAPLSAWLLKGFIEQVPAQLEDAAMMDGLSRWRAYLKITVPLIKGGLGATGLFIFILNWTEGPLAVALAYGKWTTLPVQIIDKTASPNLQAALAVLAAIPPLAIGFYIRRDLGRTFTLGALKN